MHGVVVTLPALGHGSLEGGFALLHHVDKSLLMHALVVEDEVDKPSLAGLHVF